VAASVLLAMLVGLWSLAPVGQAQAAPLVERLVDWDLAMSQARGDERQRLLEAEPRFRSDLETTTLPPDERELAGHLLETGRWLATNNDPLAEAEHFSQMADRLVARLGNATRRGENDWSRRLARLQNLVAERGVSANLERAQGSGSLDFEHRHRLEKLILSDANRMEALVDLLKQSPDATRKEIRKALGPTPRQPRSKAARLTSPGPIEPLPNLPTVSQEPDEEGK
jgi:hypothetical protein